MTDKHDGGGPVRPPILNPRRDLEDFVDTLAKMANESAAELDDLRALLGEARHYLAPLAGPGFPSNNRVIRDLLARIDEELAKGAGDGSTNDN